MTTYKVTYGNTITGNQNSITEGAAFFSKNEERSIIVNTMFFMETSTGRKNPYWEVELFDGIRSQGMAAYTDAQIRRWFPLRLGL